MITPAMLGIKDWTSETWTAIAAVVALVQPWLISVLRRFFKRGTIDIYETPIAEFGLSALGATVGLTGTLRSRHRDMFIQNISVTIRTNGAIRPFHWIAFRIPKISVDTTAGQSSEVSAEDPYSFMIRMLEPHRFNVLFTDTGLLQNAQAKVQKLKQEWLDRIQDIEVPELPLDPNVQRNLIKKLRKAHEGFSTTQTYRDTLTFLEEAFPWIAGTHELTMHITTARPDRNYKKTWKVPLSEEQIENLRNNVSFALEEAMGLPLVPGVYNFVLAPLEG